MPGTSSSTSIGLNNFELEELKATFSREIFGEMKTLFAQTHKAFISALKPSNKENAKTTPNNEETTSLRTRSTPTKRIRFEDVENLRPESPRNSGIVN